MKKELAHMEAGEESAKSLKGNFWDIQAVNLAIALEENGEQKEGKLFHLI